MGIYVGIHPDTKAVEDLRKLMLGVDLPINLKEFHVTVIYSLTPKPAAPYAGVVNPEAEYMVRPIQVDKWLNHKGEPILVLMVHGGALLQRHNFWVRAGFIPTFPVYRPHITLTEELGSIPEERVDDYVRFLNKRVQGMVFTFTRETIDEPKEIERIVEKISPIKAEGEEQASGLRVLSAKKGKDKSRKKHKIPMPRIHTHRPELDDEEEHSMHKVGFNRKARHKMVKLIPGE